jgi:2-oxo-4-hydroxy-4-carboxy-5-ureidoimidazoline decarboxylase
MDNGRRRLLLGLGGAAIAGTGWAQTSGAVEVHALDATIGKPAEGLAVGLFLVTESSAPKVAQATTGAGGQAELLQGVPLKVGRYELRFAVADYFRKRGLVLGNPPFLDIVPIRLYLGDAQRHYHVPVVFTPWSYTMHG